MKRFLIIIPISCLFLLCTACGKSQDDIQDNQTTTTEITTSEANEDSAYSAIIQNSSTEEIKEYNISADTGIYAAYNYSRKATGIVLDMLVSLSEGEIDSDFFISTVNEISSTTEEFQNTLDSIEELAIPGQYTEEYVSNVREYLDLSLLINSELLAFLDDNDQAHVEKVTDQFETIKKFNETTIPNVRKQYLESIGCNQSEIESIMANSESTSETTTEAETIVSNNSGYLFPTIEQLPYNIEILPPDSIGNRYMHCTFANNTNYAIVSYDMTVLLKDKNDKTYLTTYDTVLPGETSPTFNCFAPDSGQAADYEILKISYSYMDNNEKINVNYDAKLKTYEVH